MGTVQPGTTSAAIHRALTVLAVSALAGATALAAPQAPGSANTQQSEVTIHASGQVKRQLVGSTYSGEPVEQLDLSRQVGYGDLNLHTAAGVAQLKRRIRATARAACRQLRHLYPPMSPLVVWQSNNQACVDRAVEEGMAQVPTAIAAAEQPRRSHTQ